jgi:hypothetical protein
MRFLRISNELLRTKSYLHRDSGDVRDAICLRRNCRIVIPVGVRRRSSLAHSRGCRLILVARLARRGGRVIVHILVILSAMLALVHLVVTWDLLSRAFVARRQLQDLVSIRITIVDGAVGRYVGTCFLVASIHANEVVTRDYVEVARS